jgi:type IX secretion system PorP/SprF family membrane protein
MTMKKYICTVFCIALLGSFGKAQDVHFSQFTKSPLLINPGLTGLYDGDLRAMLNYRDQWKSVSKGFRTYSFSAEHTLMKKNNSNSYLGLGVGAFRDIAGTSNMSTTSFLVSVSGVIKISELQEFSAGIQGGFSQNSMNTSDMIWDSQYNGGYNPGLSSNETFDFTPFFFADVSAGIAYHYFSKSSSIVSNDQTRGTIGAAMYHINRPTQKYSLQEEKLHARMVVHSEWLLGISNTNMAVTPSFLYMRQGPAQEISLGALMRYRLKEASRHTGVFKEAALSLGAYYRHGDAVIPTMVLEMDNFGLGISYDLNISGLSTASNMRGGFEVSLQFLNPNPFMYSRWKTAKSSL